MNYNHFDAKFFILIIYYANNISIKPSLISVTPAGNKLLLFLIARIAQYLKLYFQMDEGD